MLLHLFIFVVCGLIVLECAEDGDHLAGEAPGSSGRAQTRTQSPMCLLLLLLLLTLLLLLWFRWLTLVMDPILIIMMTIMKRTRMKMRGMINYPEEHSEEDWLDQIILKPQLKIIL